MDWLADVCPLRRHCASAANWHVSGILPGLRLGPRDNYRYQDITHRLVGLYPSGRLKHTRPAGQI